MAIFVTCEKQPHETLFRGEMVQNDPQNLLKLKMGTRGAVQGYSPCPSKLEVLESVSHAPADTHTHTFQK